MIDTQYISQEKKDALLEELEDIRKNKIPTTAKRIDEARQMGDLSENAEYHAAREDMAWTQSRAKEIEHILSNSQLVDDSVKSDVVGIGSTIIVEGNGKEKEFTIVGAHEADPLSGKISNESPMGEAFFGKKKGDKVSVTIPAGTIEYKIKKLK